MRMLLTFGTVATAMVVPWTTLAPTFLSNASGSPTDASAERLIREPAARLNPALGIVPLSADPVDEGDRSSGAVAATSGESDEFASFATGPNVHCENGVCRIVETPGQAAQSADDRPTPPVAASENELHDMSRLFAGDRQADRMRDATADASHDASSPLAHPLTWEDARQQLRELGATQFRLETLADGGNAYRFSCALPVRPGSRASRRFEASGPSDMQAVVQVIEQIRSWRDAR